MRRLAGYLLIVTLSVGCTAAASTGSAPTPTPTPPCTMPDGRRAIDVIQQYAREWDDGLTLAGSTPRMQLAGPISQLQRVRRDVQSQQWPVCAEGVQQALVQ